jgi:hypothetical protein
MTKPPRTKRERRKLKRTAASPAARKRKSRQNDEYRAQEREKNRLAHSVYREAKVIVASEDLMKNRKARV